MTARETFTSQADPELLAKMREIAQVNERDFEAVLEDAMWVYVTCLEKPNVRPSVMAHVPREPGEEPAPCRVVGRS